MECYNLQKLTNLIYIVSITLILAVSIAPIDLYEFLLCRKCGHEIVSVNQLINRPTPHAIRQRNDTILNKEVLIQLFVNPHGSKFEVITAQKGNVLETQKAVSEYSWFTGYAWRMILCPRCMSHLGWSFEPVGYTDGNHDSKDTFLGFILSNLLQSDFADSLMVIPKAYGG